MSLSARGDLIEVGLLAEGDLDEADRIYRLAFATFLSAPDPAALFGDTDVVRTRWRTDPTAALGAYVDGRLVGSNFVTDWGAVGFFGPLTVHPDRWDQGIARRLLEATMEVFEARGTRLRGLFTFPNSPRHVGLYQSFGFWPRYLTAVLVAPVTRPPAAARPARADPAGRLDAVAALTGEVLEGLDISREIEAVQRQGLGKVLLLDDGIGLEGVAVCHLGPGTEAGTGTCYVKFAAVRPGNGAGPAFGRLLDACADLAAEAGATVLTGGVNLARVEAWAVLRARGWGVRSLGVAMHHPDEPGYSTPGAYVIDDWR